jgi:hypothetical protein
MMRKLLSPTLAALALVAVASAASSASASHHRKTDHGLRHASRAPTQVIRPSFAFGPAGVGNRYGPCVFEEAQGRFHSCHEGEDKVETRAAECEPC